MKKCILGNTALSILLAIILCGCNKRTIQVDLTIDESVSTMVGQIGNEIIDTTITNTSNDESTVDEPTSEAYVEPTTTVSEEPSQTEPPTPTEPTLSAEEKVAIREELIREELPGVVCWGDSLTFGYGGNGTSYPGVLDSLIEERVYPGIPVVNNGVCIETSQTIMVRANAYGFYTKGFVIPWHTEWVTLDAFLENGSYSNLASVYDSDIGYLAGLNPVTIEGVKGEIKARYDDNGTHNIFYFRRLEQGDDMYVGYGTQITPASAELYENYINIIFMGENGYYNGYEDLASQCQRIVDARDCDRYIVIGLTTGDNETRSGLNEAMIEHFGDKYIDMRTELINRGPALLGMPGEEGDEECIRQGKMMPYLMSDNIHLNEYGYRALAYILYERMDQLGYFNGVRDILEQYK